MVIEKSTFDFLKALSKNNNRPWFEKNRDRYEEALKNFELFITELIRKCAVYDKALANADPKKAIFRIYRDIRFSKDKTPYKTHLSAAINSAGRKGASFGFYVQVGPGVSFLGGGAWQPEADKLKKIRQEIDYNFDSFKKIINDKKFKSRYGELYNEYKLVNPPKGYDKDNPAIEWLKLTTFVAGVDLADKDVLDKKFLNQCVDGYKILKPLNDFLNTAVHS